MNLRRSLSIYAPASLLLLHQLLRSLPPRPLTRRCPLPPRDGLRRRLAALEALDVLGVEAVEPPDPVAAELLLADQRVDRVRVLHADLTHHFGCRHRRHLLPRL